MIREPQLEERAAQPYVGILAEVTMQDFGPAIPRLHGEVFGWLARQGVAPAGPPLIRYYVTDMERGLHVEMGMPVGQPVTGDARIHAGALPAGRYVTTIYRGDYAGLVDATAALLAWAQAHGIVWQTAQVGGQEVWAGRVELYHTDPGEEPDPAKWETELAFLTADAP
jgi:effector-binding domain-containing protein